MQLARLNALDVKPAQSPTSLAFPLQMLSLGSSLYTCVMNPRDFVNVPDAAPGLETKLERKSAMLRQDGFVQNRRGLASLVH